MRETHREGMSNVANEEDGRVANTDLLRIDRISGRNSAFRTAKRDFRCSFARRCRSTVTLALRAAIWREQRRNRETERE